MFCILFADVYFLLPIRSKIFVDGLLIELVRTDLLHLVWFGIVVYENYEGSVCRKRTIHKSLMQFTANELKSMLLCCCDHVLFCQRN